MNYTFARVASFCGLRLSYYSTAALIAISFLLLAPTQFRTASPLYILLTMAVLPSIVKALFFSSEQKEKRESAIAFPLFCQKYNYSIVSSKTMNISYLLLFILLAAWMFSYSQSTAPFLVRRLPVLITCCSLVIRTLGVIGFRLYFHLFPAKAMR
ncbi:MAG: hypothetical protein IJ420_05615 [Lachnospiraceae bacterium]|nr:hypothetical protein [Lachnospiraceae bacterium]MBQ8633064.1 hypothetical protein [Lachnospiraceae bacterium]